MQQTRNGTVTKRVLALCALVVGLGVVQPVAAQPAFRYYSFFGAGMTPIVSEVDDLNPLSGIGAALVYASDRYSPFVGRVSGEFLREDQTTQVGDASVTATHRTGTAYLEVLYGPRFAIDRSLRWYVGPGIGVMHERLKFGDESYTGTSLAVSGSAGLQFEWIDVMARGFMTVGSENVTAGAVLSLGLAFGPF